MRAESHETRTPQSWGSAGSAGRADGRRVARASGAARRVAHAVAPAVALVALLVGAGCGGDGGGDDDVALVEGVVVDVQALDNRFVPPEVTVRAGTEVRFVNDGRNDHDVVPADPGEGFADGIDRSGFRPGDDASVRFTVPGTYRYFCSIHGTAEVGMIGTVVVEG